MSRSTWHRAKRGGEGEVQARRGGEGEVQRGEAGKAARQAEAVKARQAEAVKTGSEGADVVAGTGYLPVSFLQEALSRAPVIGTRPLCQATSFEKVGDPNFPVTGTPRSFCATAICALC